MSSKWDDRFLQLAQHVASWSKDPSSQVGAVIVDDQRRVIAHGYNGFPRGVDDDPLRYANRDQKYPRVVHAEMNAILNACVPVRGTTLYCTMFPCDRCAGPIIQAGITRVVGLITKRDPDWKIGHDLAKEMFREAKVKYDHVSLPA